MKNVKIRTRLYAGFGIIFLLILTLGVMSYRLLSGTDSETLIQEALVLGVTVIALIFSVTMSVTIMRDIRKSLDILINAAREIAAGNANITLTKYKDDEFGEVVDEFQSIIDNIKYQGEISRMIAQGDLTADVKVNGDKDVLGNALDDIIRENNRMLSDIRESTMQVTVGSEQVSDASQALAQGATEQASATQEITASMNEIAERTKVNTEQINEANDLVENMGKEAVVINDSMTEMMSAMTDINEASENISKIIKVIDDIAFQTNILALNAAVEAARAGEAGKGFAVVAEEVRSLAAKSAAASAETAELIEDSISKVGFGSQIADDTAKAMELISNVVQESEVIINDIAESSNYQATAVAQIEQAITQVSQVVQTNSATSEQCAAASEELSNQASRMREMLSIYNLGSGSSSSFGGGSSYSSAPSNMNEQVISLGDDFGKY